MASPNLNTAIGYDPYDGRTAYISNTTASAITNNRISGSTLKQMNVDEMNHLMKGEMVSSGLTLSEMQRMAMIDTMTESGFKEHIKQQLCELLVRDMMKNNLIEFTMSVEHHHMDYTYRARAYVMPDHMTKILRDYVQRNT